MDQPVTTLEIDGLTAEIYVDRDCDSPRDFNPLGTIVAWHDRYMLADDPERFPTPEDFHAFLKRAKPPLVLPVYLLDHSGLALSTTSFNDPWDSGQVGYIYADARAIRREFARRAPSSAILARVKQRLVEEVNEFGSYVNGECYGYVLRDDEGTDVHSCWGFLGIDAVKSAARDAAAEIARVRTTAALRVS